MKRLLLLALLAGCQGLPPGSGGFDVVILGGRVMDPETGLDAVRNVGIRDGLIAAVTEAPISGRETLDARGRVVCPGFIDLHAHGQDPRSYDLKALDGCTTALELEVGTADVDAWYDARAGRSRIHFGVSAGHIPVRMAVMGDPPAFLPASTSKAAAAEGDERTLAEIQARLRHGLKRGALAVGFGIQYTPAASRWEIVQSFRVAAEFGASCHVHMRHNGMKEPNNSTQALQEVVAAAAVTGAPLHVVHLHSTSLRGTSRHLGMLSEARSRGLDVTTEIYPYFAGMTDLSSGVFGGPWREDLEIDYPDLQWVATGERLTKETFEKYRKQGGLVAIYSIPEEAVRAALPHPLVLIGSDGLMDEQGRGHPRNAGCYARILGHFVRQEKLLPLMEAIRKCSLGPAQRLERHAPMFRRKGRLQPGCDADIAVFDPGTVIDRATYERPALPSDGFSDVLVGGVGVVRGGRLVDGALPGKAARAPLR
jgi:N-acyl-D-aspartate/D-glutamate deacylase